MAKRTYLQGKNRREVNKVIRFSRDEADALEQVSNALGKSESEFAREVLLSVVMTAQSTGYVDGEDGKLKVLPGLFGPMLQTTGMGAEQSA